MKINNWYKPFPQLKYYWKNRITNDEISIRRVNNLYVGYVKVYKEMFKTHIISKRPQSLINVNADIMLYMRTHQ